MTHTEKAIRLAVEAGYISKWQFNMLGRDNNWNNVLFFKDGDNNDFVYPLSSAMIDSDFWQALGKRLGWDEDETHWQGGDFVGRRSTFEWHNLISHLADGGDIEGFFEKLLADNKEV